MVLIFISGCLFTCGDNPAGPATVPAEMPPDFAVQQVFASGTVSPPYYFAYNIFLSAVTSDSIVFHCDYIDGGSYDPPIWTYGFDAAESDLDDLYQLMRKQQAFRDEWDEIEDPPVGGSTRRLVIMVNKHEFEVPYWPENPAPLDTVYTYINSLVPSEIWDTLWARQDHYITDHTQ